MEITWTKPLFDKLVKAYNKAVSEKKPDFILTDGENEYEFVTNYAKYLIEYLEPKFKGMR